MTIENDNPMLDACLEELLGGATPPDLTARILDAYDQSESHLLDPLLDEVLAGVSPPSVAERVLQQHESASPSPATVAVIDPGVTVTSRTRRRSNRVMWNTIAATLFLAALGIALRSQGRPDSPSGNAPSVARDDTVVSEPGRSRDKLFPPSTEDVEPRSAVGQNDPPEFAAVLPKRIETATVTPVEQPTVQEHDLAATVAVQEPSRLPSSRIILSVNDLIRQRWQERDVTPAPALDDARWAQRVYSRVVGRKPTEKELVAFSADTSPDKRAKLVDQLMRGSDYIEDYARHWGNVWTEMLLATSTRQVNRDGLRQFLRRSFAAGVSLDEVVTELITATGSGTRAADAEDYNGAVNYLLAYADRDKQQVASAHVGRTFVGIAMECGQCHDDNSWRAFKQQHFWEFNTFFRQMQADPTGKLADVDFRGEGASPRDAEVYYSTSEGLLKSAYPVFVDSEVDGFASVSRSGRLEDVNRREVLAGFIVRSRFFRQAMVNRIWGELFGVGFTTPVDDLGPHNPASHPELLAKLGDQFAAHEFDMRELIQWIVLSEPFGLSPEATPIERSIGTQELFASFPGRSRSGKPLQESLKLATELYARHRPVAGGALTNARLTPTTPGAPPATLSELDRVLAMTPAEVRRPSERSLFGQIVLESDLSPEQKIEHMFFATVHRPPSKRELAKINELLKGPVQKLEEQASPTAAQDLDDALRYVWWALASSRDSR